MGLSAQSPGRRFAGAALFLTFLMVAAATAQARGAPDSFADLAIRLLPAVVNISTTETIRADAAALPGSLPPFGDVFNEFAGKDKDRPRQVAALGSGFIIDPAGLIVTNNHVIEGADSITVTLSDGTSLPATLVGRDDKTDLALLRVNPPTPLPAAHFGDSDHARVGDWVIAIGNPFGLGSSVTAGIVSGRNRDIAEGPYDDFIQTDAPINRGNSGGPLFDMQGNVVGVASALFSPSGGSVGVGFAIPSNLARAVVAQLRDHGGMRRGWIGVRIQPVTADIAESLALNSQAGALVSQATPGGPAASAGLENGDVITAFDGKPVADSRALSRLVADTPAGKAVNVDALRNGRRASYQLVVAQREEGGEAARTSSAGSGPAAPVRSSGLGLRLAPLDRKLRAKYSLGETAGVVITGVDPDSPAAEKDFRPGDVIVDVQNVAVHAPGEVADCIASNAKSGRKAVLFRISRNGQTNYIALRLGETG